jgi:DUF4097 and DUF4098 domain-containing protein YvlB
MNKHPLLIGVVALGFLLAGGPATAALPGTPGAGLTDSWSGQQQTEKFSKTVPLPKGGSFELANISGDIVITGGAGDQVVIDAVKRGRTAEDLKAVQIDVAISATRVAVRTEYQRERRNINASVDFTVTVPRGAAVTVRSVSGDLKLATIDGSLRAEAVSGNVSITSAAQMESAKSVSGDVTVETAGNDADLSTASVSGNVKMRAVKARSLEVSSVSGDVDMVDVTCDRVKANSVSGNVVFGGPLARSGRYMLQSHSGDLTVYVSGQAGFEVNASSFSGDITSDLQLTMKFGGDTQRQGRRRNQQIRGTYGDGGAVLELNTFSGDVKIVDKVVTKVIKK